MLSDKTKCVSIRIEFEDGTRLESADAENADEVWRWYNGSEQLSILHGGIFTGRPMKLVLAKQSGDKP